MGFLDTALSGASLIYSGLSYNRDSFSDNVALRQNQVYQEKNYHIAWIAAVREEVRDILSIFVGRMSNYMVVNVLIAGIAAATIVEGEVVESCPEFVAHAFYVSFVLSVLYLVLSMMLATKGIVVAYNSALKFLVEVVPDGLDLYKFNYMEQVTDKFEADLRQAFRIPFRQRLATRAQRVDRDSEHDRALLEQLPRGKQRREPTQPSCSQHQRSPQAAQPTYFSSLRTYQQLWEPFADAAQTSMIHGIVSLTHGSAYFCLGKLHDRSERWAALTLVALFVILGFVLFKDGMLVDAPDRSVACNPESETKRKLTRGQQMLQALTLALIFMAPFAIAVADVAVRPLVIAFFVPLGYISHSLFLLGFVPQEWRWSVRHINFHSPFQAARLPVVAPQLQQSQGQEQEHQQHLHPQQIQPEEQEQGQPQQAPVFRRTLSGSRLDDPESQTREDPEWLLKHLLAGCQASILRARRQGGATMALGHICAAMTWCSMLVWSVVQLPWEDLNSGSIVVEDLIVSWPSNIYFKPLALACAKQQLLLADEFGTFGLRKDKSFERLTCSNASGPFTDVTARCAGDDCWPLVLSREPRAELIDCRSGQAAALLHVPGPPDQVAAIGRDNIFALHSGLLTQYQWNPAQGILRPLWRMVQVDPHGLQAFDVTSTGKGSNVHRVAAFREASAGRPAHVEVHSMGSGPPTRRLWMLPWSLPMLRSGCLMENGTAYILLQDEGSPPRLVSTVLPNL